jgi:hypothetical protein
MAAKKVCKVPVGHPLLRSPFGFSTKWPAISQEGISGRYAPAFKKTIRSSPPKWPAINRQEGLEGAVRPQLHKVHLVSPPNDQQ